MAAPWAPLQISSGLSGSMNLSGETIRFGTHWNTLMRMVEAERTNEHQGQSAGIIAARDRFYKGAIARDVVAFPQEHQAPFELSDFADFYAKIEPPAMTTYRGYKIYKLCSAARGRSLLQARRSHEAMIHGTSL